MARAPPGPNRTLQAGVSFFDRAFCHPPQPSETALSLGQELTFSGKSLKFSVQESICFSESSPMQKTLVLKYLASGFVHSFLISFPPTYFSIFSSFFFFSEKNLPQADAEKQLLQQAARQTCLLPESHTPLRKRKRNRYISDIESDRAQRNTRDQTLLLSMQGINFCLPLAFILLLTL